MLTIMERIRETLPDMPPLYRKIAVYILENDNDIGFSSIQAFGEAVGVSSATIVRFARSLGLEGYADLKRSVQAGIKRRLDPYEKIALSGLDLEPRERQLADLRENELNNLKRTLDDMDIDTLSGIVTWITEAERVFVSGFGFSHHIVQLLGNSISSALGKQVIPITGSVSDFTPRLRGVSEGDAFIVMTFPPYSREAILVTELARARGARIALFTDSPRCPAYPFADSMIRCESNSLLMANSYVGIFAAMQIISNLLCLSNKKEATRRLKELSEIERDAYERLAGIDNQV